MSFQSNSHFHSATGRSSETTPYMSHSGLSSGIRAFDDSEEREGVEFSGQEWSTEIDPPTFSESYEMEISDRVLLRGRRDPAYEEMRIRVSEYQNMSLEEFQDWSSSIRKENLGNGINMVCPICLEDLPTDTKKKNSLFQNILLHVCWCWSPEKSLKLNCGHSFHKHCIKGWLIQVRSKCPMCLEDVRKPWAAAQGC